MKKNTKTIVKKILLSIMLIIILSVPFYFDSHKEILEIFTQGSSNPRFNTFNNIKVNRVYDGDTIFADLNCSEELFCKNIGVRLLNIDAPEIRTKNDCEKKKALEAKQYVENKINNAKEINIINPGKGKYFRIVGDVILDGQSLSQDLIKNDLAVHYDGGTKEVIDWCEN